MMSLRALFVLGFAFMVAIAAPAPQAFAADPLSDWNEGPAKTAILDFVKATTTPGSPDFLPVEQRIAVFDNDGTLWAEQPVYFQFAYQLDQIKALAPNHPEWQTEEPFASILKGDTKAAFASNEAVLKLIGATALSGQTLDQYKVSVAEWLKTEKHPLFNRRYDELVYAPMLQVLTYLRANGYKTFIVSGGTADFIRAFAWPVYGIPPEQVVGSGLKMKFEIRDSVPEVVPVPQLDFLDDGPNKPVGIARNIGAQPVIAFGNGDGDLQMLQYTTGRGGKRLGFIIHHTDAEREFAYDRDTKIGKLDRALDMAPAQGWHVVDMKKDWKRVFPFQ